MCTGEAKKVKEAQMSFPSGHSSAAFAGFGFLALYLNAKMKVIGRKPDAYPFYYSQNGDEKVPETEGLKRGTHGRGRTSHWKLALWILPWLIALLIASSKVRDGWHHPVDVLFGALVGTAFAHMAYWCCFRGVYDGRVNDVPRTKAE